MCAQNEYALLLFCHSLFNALTISLQIYCYASEVHIPVYHVWIYLSYEYTCLHVCVLLGFLTPNSNNSLHPAAPMLINIMEHENHGSFLSFSENRKLVYGICCARFGTSIKCVDVSSVAGII